MNNIKFANFSAILNLKSTILLRTDLYSSIFAGMYMLIVLVKDGFAGAEELRKNEEEELAVKIRREIKRTLNLRNQE